MTPARRDPRAPRQRVYCVLLAAMLAPPLAAYAAERTFEFRVVHGVVPANERHVRVNEGDVVTLLFTSDRALLLHLHGYELEWRVEPGTPASVTFTARLTGRFPVHAHDAGGRAHANANAETALVYVDVYPR
jgi:hypothetical protein